MNITCDVERFIREVIETNEYKFMFRMGTVIDVGCNIGTFSFWIYNLADTIHAIDLSEKNIDNLKATIKENKLTKITPYHCAIGGGTGIRNIQTSGKEGGGAWRLSDFGDMQVQTYSLRDFMSRNSIGKIDLLKIDIEGGELELLEAPDFPTDLVGKIVGEAHGGNVGTCNVLLTKLGYKPSYNGDGYFMGIK